MPKRSSTEATSAAALLGRLGGLKGGAARAAALSPDERSRIARAAASIRWKKKPPENPLPMAKEHVVNQLALPIIPHAMDGKLIYQRASDGYINATAMCNAAGKKISHYFEVKGTQDFFEELSKDTKLPIPELAEIIKGGNPDYQGTWVHPQVAIHLAQWLSPKFAVQVSKWVYEWLSGGGATTTVPEHIRRYMANRSEIPNTHFSMLNELTFGLIAPLEADGYTLPEKLMPDISEGKLFCNWLRTELNIEPKEFPTYKHRFLDGRVVDARLYPNQLLPVFRKHFHEVWIPQRAEGYFKERDPKALKYLPKLLPPPQTPK